MSHLRGFSSWSSALQRKYAIWSLTIHASHHRVRINSLLLLDKNNTPVLSFKVWEQRKRNIQAVSPVHFRFTVKRKTALQAVLRLQFACVACVYSTATSSSVHTLATSFPSMITAVNEHEVWHYPAIIQSETCRVGGSSTRRRKLCRLWRTSNPAKFPVQARKARKRALEGKNEAMEYGRGVNLLWHFRLNTSVCQNISTPLWFYSFI